MTGLDPDTILNLLKQAPQRKPKQPKNVTEPREYTTWWRLRHTIREEGCDNPNCIDPRPKGDVGSNVVVEINGKFTCRYCFIDGYART